MNSTIGLKRGTVKLSPYSKTWPAVYKKEAKLLKSTFKNYSAIIDIQHVGSTSVFKLKSKPIIDLAIGVQFLKDGEKCFKALANLGYEYKGEAGVKGRHFFVKGPAEKRTHCLHLVKHNGKQWQTLILWRDYLKKFPLARQAYQKIKEAAAAKHKNNREAYTAEKNDFISAIIKKVKNK